MLARLDHVALWVADPVAAAAFYTDVVGLTAVRLDEYRAGAAPFPSVRVSDETVLDLMDRRMADALNAMAGRASPLAAASAGHLVNHICLAMSASDYRALRERLTSRGIDTSHVMTRSFGARGLAPEAFYFHDLDGNVLEARHYEEQP
jgi:catechol 2,3-dioxygenase-like lactoylglutathione lyase family enzyme